VKYSIQPRPRFTLALFLCLVAAVALPLRAQKSALEEVATFPKQQVTGVTVSLQGRVFVNFPFWSDDHTLSVAEIIDGKPKAFPDEAWDAKSGSPEDPGRFPTSKSSAMAVWWQWAVFPQRRPAQLTVLK
jgi:hypothetical protein